MTQEELQHNWEQGIGLEFHGEPWPQYRDRIIARDAISIRRGFLVKSHNITEKPKFDNISCSNCGLDFGPGNHGFSHCESHKRRGACVPGNICELCIEINERGELARLQKKYQADDMPDYRQREITTEERSADRLAREADRQYSDGKR